jgi:hypothetical protein
MLAIVALPIFTTSAVYLRGISACDRRRRFRPGSVRIPEDGDYPVIVRENYLRGYVALFYPFRFYNRI